MSLLGRLFRKPSIATSPSTSIDDATWQDVLDTLPFLRAHAVLRELAAQFLARKPINQALSWPTGVPALDHASQVAISAQACLPILAFGLDFYDAFSEVIVYPGEFLVEREAADEDGVVHDLSGALLGETSAGGPVVIGWDTSGQGQSISVVVHEFAHKLDLAAGEADGTPRFHPRLHDRRLRAQWLEVLDRSFDAFVETVDAFEDRFPKHLDPESDAGLALYDSLPLDPYASTDPAEFFAVSSEAYFVDPARLAKAIPEWAAMLDRYYRPASTITATPR